MCAGGTDVSGKARTVLGDVAAETLGFVLMHEHVFLRTPGFAENYPSTFPRDKVAELACSDLEQLRRKGVNTIVDMTTVDLGRDARLLAQISDLSSMNIVSTTGSHTGIPNYFQARSAQRIADLFIRDIRDGIADTDIRAGIVKCSMEDQAMTDQHAKLLEAAAITHLETGVPISTHSSAGVRNGLLQAHALRDLGVDMSRVIIGHSGDTVDLSYLKELLDMGCSLGLDRFGLERFLPTADRCQVAATLCRDGFANQLVLSQDAFCFHDSVSRKFRDAELASWRMDLLPDVVIPALRGLGVSDVDIETMTVTNPARLLTISGIA